MIDLLKKWLAGSVEWKEEKQLRKQAERDTFLADAMEGYDRFPTINHSEQLATLQEKLKQKHDTPKKQTSPFIGRAIAASLALLLSAGLFFLLQNPLQNQSPLSDSRLQEKSLTASDANTESFSYNKSTPLAATEHSSTSLSEAVTTLDKKITNEKEVITPQKETPPNPNPPLKSTKTLEPINIQETITTRPPLAQNREKRQIEAQKPTRIETPQADIVMIDEPAAVGAMMEIEEAAIMTAEDSEQAAIIAEQIPSTETTASDKLSKNSNDIIRARTAPKMEQSIKPQLASPVGGMKKFNRYIKKNIQHPNTNTPTGNSLLPLTGSVLLSFSVSDSGEITDIKVVKGINKSYNQEAIRLLREGPKWISNGIAKGEYEVVFE